MAFTIVDVAVTGIDAVTGFAGYATDGTAVPPNSDSNKIYQCDDVGSIFILTIYINPNAPYSLPVASMASGLMQGKYLAKAAGVPAAQATVINYAAIV